MINLAVIDLGSNSVRLRITEINESGNYNLVSYEKEYVRLSENMGPEKMLKPAPMDRTIKALQHFKQLCMALENVRVIAVATAAVRQAANQTEFLKRVKAETGFSFKVISGEREAYLDYVGVTRTLPIKNGLIIDTGGASMELIYVDDGQAEEIISLPIGAVLLSQEYHLDDQINSADLLDAIVRVDHALGPQHWLQRARHQEVVALGGSNRALAKIYRWQLEAQGKGRQPVHGLKMSTADANRIMHSLLAMDKKQRANVHGIASERADVIVGGLLPLMAILRQLDVKQLTFSNNGLREGLMFKFLDHEIMSSIVQPLTD